MEKTGNPGEEKAWEILSTLKPEEVCRAADVSHDAASGTYLIRSFGMDFFVSPRDKSISSTSPGSDLLLRTLGYFFRLSLLWYLASAKEIACSGRPVKLENVRGGDIFTKGSHVLPLDSVARKYGRDKGGFMEKGRSLGAEPAPFGDAALKLFPLPRVPVVLALWVEDEEFPARADLLFDSTCSIQIPVDILWSIAMTSVMAML